MTHKTLYDLLDVSPDASAEELRKAHHLLILAWHPDRFPEDSKEQAAERMRQINAAFDVLSDEQMRSEYDRLLRAFKNQAEATPRERPEFSYVRPQVFTHVTDPVPFGYQDGFSPSEAGTDLVRMPFMEYRPPRRWAGAGRVLLWVAAGGCLSLVGFNAIFGLSRALDASTSVCLILFGLILLVLGLFPTRS